MVMMHARLDDLSNSKGLYKKKKYQNNTPRIRMITICCIILLFLWWFWDSSRKPNVAELDKQTEKDMMMQQMIKEEILAVNTNEEAQNFFRKQIVPDYQAPPNDDNENVDDNENEETEEDDISESLLENTNDIDSSLQTSFSNVSFVPKPQIFAASPRTFAYAKSSECTYLCRTLKSAGWKSTGSYLAKTPEMIIASYSQAQDFARVKKSALNLVGKGSSCIGGGKGKQLKCRENFAEEHQCQFSELGIQPQQWNIQEESECKRFFEDAAKGNQDQIWIVKPGGSFHGSGIKIYQGTEKLQSIYPCTKKLPDGIIVQKYISDPALIQGHKFDFRTYLLVASIDPFIVFYHDGFVRKSSNPYDTSEGGLSDPSKHVTNARGQEKAENHFYNFEQLEKILHEESGFARDFLRKKIIPQAKRATLFLAKSYTRLAKSYGTNNVPRFQLFAVDWVLDAKGGLHMLEANGNPQISSYPIDNFTPLVWTAMYDLVHTVLAEPYTLDPNAFSVRNRYVFQNRWHLVYNELEEVNSGEAFNPCKMEEYIANKHSLYSFEPLDDTEPESS